MCVIASRARTFMHQSKMIILLNSSCGNRRCIFLKMKSFDRQMDNVETLTEKLACGLDQTLVYMFYRLGACDGKNNMHA
jgi:hypothetical protein